MRAFLMKFCSGCRMYAKELKSNLNSQKERIAIPGQTIFSAFVIFHVCVFFFLFGREIKLAIRTSYMKDFICSPTNMTKWRPQMEFNSFKNAWKWNDKNTTIEPATVGSADEHPPFAAREEDEIEEKREEAHTQWTVLRRTPDDIYDLLQKFYSIVDTLNDEQCSGIHFSRLSHDVSTAFLVRSLRRSFAGCVSLCNWIAYVYKAHGTAYKIARSLRLMAPAISSMFTLAKSDYPCVPVATYYIVRCCRWHFLPIFLLFDFECESRWTINDSEISSISAVYSIWDVLGWDVRSRNTNVCSHQWVGNGKYVLIVERSDGKQ